MPPSPAPLPIRQATLVLKNPVAFAWRVLRAFRANQGLLLAGAVAYYATYVVGQAAEEFLAHGKSWGEKGPKQVIRAILDGIDRDSILAQARSDIAARLSGGRK